MTWTGIIIFTIIVCVIAGVAEYRAQRKGQTMNCLICGNDITETVKQFCDTKNPMCQSCYLAGNSWVYDEPVIVDGLSRGLNLHEAIKHCVKEEISDLQKFAEDFLNLPFTDPTPATSEDETAAYHGQERAV